MLHTYGSGKDLACVLYQTQEGKLRRLEFGSRPFLRAERKYYSSKLKFLLALKWTIFDNVREIICAMLNTLFILTLIL